MKVVAVIPVHGRLPLVKITIERLFKRNDIYYVICVGGTDEEKEVCNKAGAAFVYHENQPLGKKWNAGFKEAERYDADAAIFVGSSDWISDEWVPFMSQYLGEYDMVGTPGFYMADVSKEIRVCHWAGYEGQRKGESIGIGRMLSADILKKMNWKPFEDDKSRSLDYQMLRNVLANEGRVKLVKSSSIKSLSISTSLWPNLHQFEDHWSDKLPSTKIYDHNFLPTHFPEVFKIF